MLQRLLRGLLRPLLLGLHEVSVVELLLVLLGLH
jgi:hypothetical protein